MQHSLMPHQQLIVDFIKRTPKSGIFVGIGSGKTTAVLSALTDIKPSGHILVVAPLAIARSTWLDEIDKWGFKVRTKSLIVDENDKPLSRKARIKAIQDIATDPPTMYFINNDLLSLPSTPTTALVTTPELVTTQMTNKLNADEKVVLELTSQLEPIAPDKLFAETTNLSRHKFNKTVKSLKDNHYLDTVKLPCPKCKNKGCANCSAGLLNQLVPRRDLIGYDKAGRRQFLDTVEWPFPTVIIDESQNMKNFESVRYLSIARVSSQIKRMIQLTGTPAPQSLLDLWSQMYLLDGGKSLGENFYDFRSRWFFPTKEINNRPIAWELTPGAEAQIHALVAPYAMSTTNTKIPLPQVVYDPSNNGLYPANRVEITLPKTLQETYKNFVKEQVMLLATPTEDEFLSISADNAAILANKLVQFASGAVYIDDPLKTGKREYAVIHDEKLQRLGHLLDNCDGNVLIGYRYQSERDEILKFLKKRKYQAELFDGSRDNIKRWNNGEIEVMMIHPASGGPGLNLQNGGHTLIWYTLPDSSEHFQQLNGRVNRIGQQQPVQIYYLAVKGTRDGVLDNKVLRPKLIQQNALISAVHRTSENYEDMANQIFEDLHVSITDTVLD